MKILCLSLALLSLALPLSSRADSLWRTLMRGWAQGILVRSGEGTRAEAFRDSLAPRIPAA